MPDSSFTIPVDTTATGSQCLEAWATAGGQQVNVTTSVQWQTGTPSIVTPENQIDPMCVQSGDLPGSTTLFAQYTSGSTIINSDSITVTVQ
jgi:hypothetical protein